MNYLELGYSKLLIRETGGRQKLGKVSLSELRAILPDAFIGSDLKVRAGQDDYADGEGFFIGKSGGVYKMSIGDDSNYVQWDGSSLGIKGLLTLSEHFGNKAYAVADLPIPPSTEGPNSPSGMD